MSEKETRIRNLNAVLAAQFGGVKSRPAKELGHERPGYVIELLNGKKSFGEKVARGIELKLGLKKGTLDATSAEASGVRDSALPYQPSLSDEARQLAADWQQLDEPLRSQIMVMIHSLVVAQKKSERAAAKRAREQGNPPRLQPDA